MRVRAGGWSRWAGVVAVLLATGCGTGIPTATAPVAPVPSVLPAAPVVVDIEPAPTPAVVTPDPPTPPPVAPTPQPSPLPAPSPAPTPVPEPTAAPAPVEPSPQVPPPVAVPDPVPPPVESPAPVRSPSGGGDLQSTLDDAVRVVDGFWATHWGELFTGTYTPPRVVGLYDGTDPEAPRCGGRPLPALNAVYCVPEDFVAWDVRLMELRTRIGPTWPYLVVAHEWGHAVQSRLDTTLQDRAVELQADCLAGAVLYGAVADGTLVLADDAPAEIAAALAAAADETPFTDVTDHGDARERSGAFDEGRTGGVRACLPTAAAP